MGTVIPGLLGALAGLGGLLVVAGLRGVDVVPPRPVAAPRLDALTAKGAVAVLVGLVGVVVTGWPVGGALLGLATLAAPSVAGGFGEGKRLVARTEAVAAWAEMLRDTMAGAAGIEQAVTSTAVVAPPLVRDEVQRLAARLAHDRPAAALAGFAAAVDDPAADLVVAALALSADRPARDLGALLGALARSARQEAAMVLRVEASRARLQTAVRVVVGFTFAFAAGMVLFNRSYLAPFDDALGQGVLLLVGAAFAAAVVQLKRMAEFARPERVLA